MEFLYKPFILNYKDEPELGTYYIDGDYKNQTMFYVEIKEPINKPVIKNYFKLDKLVWII